MADILIRGIEMPDNVEGCEVILRIQPNGEVLDIHKIHIGITAIPLPKGHGNLIDINAPIRVAYYDGTIHETTPSRLLYKHSLLDLPKIIVPAEGDIEDS